MVPEISAVGFWDGSRGASPGDDRAGLRRGAAVTNEKSSAPASGSGEGICRDVSRDSDLLGDARACKLPEDVDGEWAARTHEIRRCIFMSWTQWPTYILVSGD